MLGNKSFLENLVWLWSMKCLAGSLALCLHMKFLSTLSYTVLAAIGLLPSHSLAWWSGWLTVPRYDLQPASRQHWQHNTRRCAFKLTTKTIHFYVFSQPTNTQRVIWFEGSVPHSRQHLLPLYNNMLQNHMITFSSECNKSTKISATIFGIKLNSMTWINSYGYLEKILIFSYESRIKFDILFYHPSICAATKYSLKFAIR